MPVPSGGLVKKTSDIITLLYHSLVGMKLSIVHLQPLLADQFFECLTLGCIGAASGQTGQPLDCNKKGFIFLPSLFVKTRLSYNYIFIRLASRIKPPLSLHLSESSATIHTMFFTCPSVLTSLPIGLQTVFQLQIPQQPSYLVSSASCSGLV